MHLSIYMYFLGSLQADIHVHVKYGSARVNCRCTKYMHIAMVTKSERCKVHMNIVHMHTYVHVIACTSALVLSQKLCSSSTCIVTYNM